MMKNENKCHSGTKPCSESDDSKCVPNEFWCDGFSDCPNSIDEHNCEKCNEVRWQCTNTSKLNCIRLDWRCDGEKDCKDGSDEVNCGSNYLSQSTVPSTKRISVTTSSTRTSSTTTTTTTLKRSPETSASKIIVVRVAVTAPTTVDHSIANITMLEGTSTSVTHLSDNLGDNIPTFFLGLICSLPLVIIIAAVIGIVKVCRRRAHSCRPTGETKHRRGTDNSSSPLEVIHNRLEYSSGDGTKDPYYADIDDVRTMDTSVECDTSYLSPIYSRSNINESDIESDTGYETPSNVIHTSLEQTETAQTIDKGLKVSSRSDYQGELFGPKINHSFISNKDSLYSDKNSYITCISNDLKTSTSVQKKPPVRSINVMPGWKPNVNNYLTCIANETLGSKRNQNEYMNETQEEFMNETQEEKLEESNCKTSHLIQGSKPNKSDYLTCINSQYEPDIIHTSNYENASERENIYNRLDNSRGSDHVYGSC